MIAAVQAIVLAVGGSSPAAGSWSVALRIGLALVLTLAAVVLAGECFVARSRRARKRSGTPARSPEDGPSVRRVA